MPDDLCLGCLGKHDILAVAAKDCIPHHGILEFFKVFGFHLRGFMHQSITKHISHDDSPSFFKCIISLSAFELACAGIFFNTILLTAVQKDSKNLHIIQKWDSKGIVSLWQVWAEPNINIIAEGDSAYMAGITLPPETGI